MESLDDNANRLCVSTNFRYLFLREKKDMIIQRNSVAYEMLKKNLLLSTQKNQKNVQQVSKMST